MQFGLFGSAQAKRGGSDVDSGQGFKDFVEYNVEAESLGFASTFVVEHHFTGFGQVSASLNLLTWVAAKTTTLRLGTAVIVLPWHNPVLLAEQAATIDLMSDGRLRARRRQGLSPQRVRELLHSARASRGALRGGSCAHCQIVDLRRAVFAPRQALAFREYHRRAAAEAKAASANMDSSRQPGLDQEGCRIWIQAAAGSICLDRDDRRTLQSVQIRGRKARPKVRSDGRRGLSRLLRRPQCGRQGSGHRKSSGGTASHDRLGTDAGWQEQIQHDVLCRYARSNRGKRAL